MKPELADQLEPTPASLAGTDQSELLRALGNKVLKKRVAERLTLEQAARQSGVSAATLSRLERQATGKASGRGGRPGIVPDTRTIAALVQWIGTSLDEVLDRPKPAMNNDESQITNMPDFVEAHLRADRNLDSTTAQMLSKMFRLAYEQYSALSEDQPTDSNDSSDSEP